MSDDAYSDDEYYDDEYYYIDEGPVTEAVSDRISNWFHLLHSIEVSTMGLVDICTRMTSQNILCPPHF